MTSSADEVLFDTRPRGRTRSRQKSAVTNGSRLIVGTDNRGPWIRRCKDVIADLVSDKGGSSEISSVEFSIIRRCATLTVELELLEKKFAEAGQASDCDLDLYGRTSGNLRRMFETLGIDRRARTVVPLDEVLKRLDREEAAATAEAGAIE